MSYDDEKDSDESDSFYDVAEPTPARKPAPSGGWTCLAIVLAGGGLGVLLICCGGGGALIWFGMNVISAEIEDQLRDNATLQEHLGAVESFSMDFVRTAAKDDADTMVFRVKGSLNEGFVTVVSETDQDGDEVIRSAVLRLPDGKEIPLVP